MPDGDLMSAVWNRSTAPFVAGAAIGGGVALVVCVALDVGIDYALWAVIIGAIIGLIFFGLVLGPWTMGLVAGFT